MNAYRQQILKILKKQLPLIKLSSGSLFLDFGAGDGWFASQMSESNPGAYIRAIDVQARDTKHYDVEIVAPDEIFKFSDHSIDLVYSVDVLHHCDDPMQVLKELSRISSNYLLIKDHVAFSATDNLILGILDELGNRRFGIPSNYHYQQNWQWESMLLAEGWQTVSKVWPAPCHTGILGKLTNRLQYVALYRSPFAVDKSSLQHEVDAQHESGNGNMSNHVVDP